MYNLRPIKTYAKIKPAEKTVKRTYAILADMKSTYASPCRSGRKILPFSSPHCPTR